VLIALAFKLTVATTLQGFSGKKCNLSLSRQVFLLGVLHLASTP
jgi:hypothetical protein